MNEFDAITPVNFFQLSCACEYLPDAGEFPRMKIKDVEKYVLPDTSVLCNEEHFADVGMGWNEQGLEFCFKVSKQIENVYFPDIAKGDSIEIFIDTRNVKTSGFNTRFCHHFFFLPEAVEGRQVGEITHFRTEDAHELCNASELKVKVTTGKGSYILQSFIPRHCLIGFDPLQFDKLGFSYRINRPRWQSQHFSTISEDYKIEEQPSLWSQIRMVR